MAEYSEDVLFTDDDPYVGSNISDRGGLLDYGRGKEKRRSRDWEKMRTDPKTMAAQLEFEYGINPNLAMYIYKKAYNNIGSDFVDDTAKIKAATAEVADIFKSSVSIINKQVPDGLGGDGSNYTTNVSQQEGTERQDLIVKRLNEEGYIPFSSNEEFLSVMTSHDTGAKRAIQNGEEIDFNPDTRQITYGGETYNTDSRSDSNQNKKYLSDIEDIRNSDDPEDMKAIAIANLEERVNDSRALVGSETDYTDLGVSKGQTQEEFLASMREGKVGSQSNSYDNLLGDYNTEDKSQEDVLGEVRVARENAGSHEAAMYRDSQTGGNVNANQGADAYNALQNNIDVVEEVTAEEEVFQLEDGTPNDVTPIDESTGEAENSGSSFSGTVAIDDPYRDLLGGQLGQGISDSLAGRPSNSLLAGERMGAEAMSRAAADNMGVASQGVSNAGMIGQGAAINATQAVGRQNLQQLGDLSAKNTALRGKEQLDSRGQAQQYLQYSEGVRQNKVAEDQMKLDSLLEWYRETKPTHVGQADAILDQFDSLAGVNMTEDQKAYQIEQANKVGEEGASQDLFTSLKD